MTEEALRLVNRKIQQVAERVTGHAEALDRQQDVQQLLVAAVEALDRKLERVLLKLEHRDD